MLFFRPKIYKALTAAEKKTTERTINTERIERKVDTV